MNPRAVDPEDAATTAKTVVSTAIIYFLDAHLAQGRCAHDAWLDSDVQGRTRERVFCHFGCELLVGEYFINRLEFSMPSRL